MARNPGRGAARGAMKELPTATPGRSGAGNTTGRWLQQKFVENFLLIGLVVAVAVALSWPDPGVEVSQHKVGSFQLVLTVNICTIFIISGLTLDTQDIVTANTAFRSLAYGLIAILIITPSLGFGIVRVPFEPEEFALGLAIFVAVPTTLSSGVAMVALVRGNTALALMLTIGSNLVGVATVPFTIDLVTSQKAAAVDIDTLALLVKLLATVLLPVVVGKGLRELVPWLHWLAEEHKRMLSILSDGSLALIVWQLLSRSRDLVLDQRIRDVGIIAGVGAGVHTIFLVWNFAATVALVLPRWEKRAVVLMASQKMLPVSLTVVTFLDQSLWDRGLLAIPCILGHLVQLLIDAMIVARWASVADCNARGCRDSIERGGGPKSEDNALKDGLMLVSNPLASKDPSVNGIGDGVRYGAAVGGASEPMNSPHGGASLRANSISISSEDSFQSAHTAFSATTPLSARGTPRSDAS